MSAVLKISIDSADVRAALSGVVGAAESANRQLAGIRQKGKRDYDRTLDEERRAAIRNANEKLRAEEKAAKAKTKAEEEAQKRIQRINANLALFQQKTAKARTADEEREAKKRTRIAENEAKEAERIAQAKARAAERAERDQTRSAERESTRRQRLQARGDRQIRQQYQQDMRLVRQQQVEEGRSFGRSARRGAGFAMNVIGAAGAATSEYLGAAAGARGQWGEREHNINASLVQAGITGTAGTAAHQRISQFLVSGQGQGINGDELASALLATQTQTNLLARQGGLENFLQNAQLAASTYQDVGEVTRVGGILGQLGVTGGDQRNALMSLIGISRAGSVELRDVSQTALQGIQMAIGQQLSANPNVTGAARSQLISQTAAQALAVTEVGAAQGMTARDSLNAYNKLTRGMTSSNTIEHLRGSLHSRYNDRDFNRIDSEMFEEYQDARGARHHRLRNGNVLEFGQRLTELYGGSTSELLNAMAAGSDPMTFDAQTRRLLGSMTGRDEEGKTGWQRVTALKGQAVSEGDVQAGADTLAGEMRTKDTTTAERHLQGLATDRPTQNAVQDVNAYRAAHPWMSTFVRGLADHYIPGAGGVAEMGVAQLMGFAGTVPGGQNTQRGAGGGGGAGQAVPVEINERSAQRIANSLRGVPITARVDQHTAAVMNAADPRSPAQRNGTE